MKQNPGVIWVSGLSSSRNKRSLGRKDICHHDGYLEKVKANPQPLATLQVIVRNFQVFLRILPNTNSKVTSQHFIIK